MVFVSELAGQQGDLLSVIRNNHNNRISSAAAVARGLVEGLSYLHCVKRIIHRDLKPQVKKKG